MNIFETKAAAKSNATSEELEQARRWQFRAATLDGSLTNGHVLAANQEDARSAIRRLKLMPLEVRPEARQRVQKAPIPVDQLAMGLRILADLFDAGLPINRVLTTFDGLAPPAWRAALPALHGAIREGRSFAQALDGAPVAFPVLVTGVIGAGEAGSGIAAAIRRAGDLMESAAETRAAVRAALTYPLILASAGTASIALLIGVVLPRFAEILADLGQELPASTQLLINGSLAVQRSFVPGALLTMAAIVAWYFWVQSDNGLRAWHRLLLAVPGIASFRLATASSRACTALSTLLTSGISLPIALGHAARATGDAEIGTRIGSVRNALAKGESLADAVNHACAMTPTAIRLIGAGEQAGRLPEMLLHAGKIEQAIADRMLRASVRMLEPILVLTFASVVGLVAAALLQAVYSVRPGG